MTIREIYCFSFTIFFPSGYLHFGEFVPFDNLNVSSGKHR